MIAGLMSLPIYIPLINPNEPEALLVSLAVRDGQQVAAGSVLCTLETTKSTQDLIAEHDGFITNLQLKQGRTVNAGELLCYLADTPDWQPEEKVISNQQSVISGVVSNAQQSQPRRQVENTKLPTGLRITQPALAFANQMGLELNRLPIGPLVTERVVRELVEEKEFDPTAIIVYGGGGHGKSLIELLRVLAIGSKEYRYRIVGVVDDGIPKGALILGMQVLGGGEVLPTLVKDGIRLAVNGVGGIGSLAVRIRIFQRLLEAGFTCPLFVHPGAIVEYSATLAAGVQVFPQAYVGSEVQIGFGSIINTGAIASHDCILGEFVNLSPGAVLAGEVQVGGRVLIGMGVTVNLRVKIGAGARIGNGATIKADVPDNGLVRAGTIWPD